MIKCRGCGEIIDVQATLKLYEYAAEAYYYGYQYRTYYEQSFLETSDPPKPSLAFAGEAFAWVALAALSGAIGNASYDAVKHVIKGIVSDVEANNKRSLTNFDFLLELSDEKLGTLIGSIKDYGEGMGGITKEVRLAIVEEIVADAVSHNPALSSEMWRLMGKKKVTAKERKRFAELLRNAMAASRQRSQPPKGVFNGLWARIGK